MNPLQIFEKHPAADAYRVGGFYSPYALVSQDKRFTEAELAAEYWCEYAEAMFWAPNQGRLRADQSALHKAANKHAAIIERFAAAPHYDQQETV
jgi:hypothetical protein